MYAYQLRGQMLTLWVYDPNSPGNDNVTMVLDLSRTDQNLINVVSNIDVTHSITCFFTNPTSDATGRRMEASRGPAQRGPDPFRRRRRDPVRAGPRRQGLVGLWPDKPGKWSAWYPIGDNTFPPGAPISAVRTRSEEGAVTLFVPGLDGKVWSAYWPDKPGKWSAWYPIGDNTFPPGAPISAVRTRSEEGAVTLFVPGLDGKVWSAYWPDKPGKWSAWYPIGDNTFPPGAPISAVHPFRRRRRDPVRAGPRRQGLVGLLAGQAGQVVGLVPDRGQHLPAGRADQRGPDPFPEEGAVTLFVPGLDGKVWSAYWPDRPGEVVGLVPDGGQHLPAGRADQRGPDPFRRRRRDPVRAGPRRQGLVGLLAGQAGQVVGLVPDRGQPLPAGRADQRGSDPFRRRRRDPVRAGPRRQGLVGLLAGQAGPVVGLVPDRGQHLPCAHLTGDPLRRPRRTLLSGAG